jgi:hypothetical protein
MKKTASYTRASSALLPNYDVLWSIEEEQKAVLEVTKRFKNTKYVKGHADKEKSELELTLQERLNIQADALATQFLEEATDPITHKQYRLPICRAYLKMGQKYISATTLHDGIGLNSTYNNIIKRSFGYRKSNCFKSTGQA